MRRVAEAIAFAVAFPFFIAAHIWYSIRRADRFDEN